MKAILMSGVAGSGKSTWAKKYAQHTPNTIIISSDDVRYELFQSYTPKDCRENLVEKTILHKIEEAADQGINVILDMAVIKNRSRTRWFNRLKKFYRIVDLVYFDIPLTLCLENNLKRERHVPEDVIRNMYDIREEPNEMARKQFNCVTIINSYTY